MSFTILLSTGEIHSVPDHKGTLDIADGNLAIKDLNGICVALYPKGVWLYFIQADKVKTSKQV